MNTLPEQDRLDIVQGESMPFDETQPLSHPLLKKVEDKELKLYKIGAVIIYILAYIYVIAFTEIKPFYFLPLAMALISLTEVISRRKSTFLSVTSNQIETITFFILTLGQALAISLWGFRIQMEIFQFLALHSSFIFYVAARNGWLVQRRLGIMIWFDAIQNSLILPFKHFLLFFKVITQPFKVAKKRTDQQNTMRFKQFNFILLSIVAAFLLVTFSWTQLIQVSDKFATLTETFGEHIFQLFEILFESFDLLPTLSHLTIALPVALWLYGLILGSSLGKKRFALTYRRFQRKISPLKVFPPATAYIVIISLCLIYGLFFLVAISELSSLLSLTQIVSPQDASTVAVSGFWQLVRVSLLNFAVLGAFYLLADKPLWDRKGTRLALTCLFSFATLFALLAGWKLFGIYIFLYGPTPLRLLSGWFLLVLLVWCLLTLVRLYKPIQAIRIGTLYAFISFTLLCYLYGFLIP